MKEDNTFSLKIEESFDYSHKIQFGSAKLPSNRITTSKYNWHNFVPRIVTEQFSKMANLYFLFVAVLQSYREVSITDGRPIILVPITFILCLNGVKDIYEDFMKKRSDNEENNRTVLKKEGNAFVSVCWADIAEGDIVQVKRNESVPADLVLLSSSSEDNTCFLETKNLDGETNLKQFRVVNGLEYSDLDCVGGQIETQKPNDKIYEFEARIEANSNSFFADKHNFLLRGTVLRQTEWIVGVSVYTGHSTKIMKNLPESKYKTSKIESQMSTQILWILLLEVIISVLYSSLSFVFWEKNRKFSENVLLLELKAFNFRNWLVLLGTSMMMFTNMIPISLLITMETIKLAQANFMQWDAEMYDVEGKQPMTVQCSTLNEDLGQVTHVFCDKTGTLTKNIMTFRGISIRDKIALETGNVEVTDKYGKIPFCSFDRRSELDLETEEAELMLLNMVCNHSCFVQKGEERRFVGSSSDEVALLNGARALGVLFEGKEASGKIRLDWFGSEREVIIHAEIEYSSERKRMSVILEVDGSWYLFCKGADSILGELAENKHEFDLTSANVYSMASIGLRTLVFGYRQLSLEETEIVRNKTIKGNSLELLEKDLKILGSTGIEDVLQDELSLCLESFMSIDMKVHILTGDKRDTAIGVAKACNLLEGRELVIIPSDTSIEEGISSLASTTALYSSVLLLESAQLAEIQDTPTLHHKVTD